jgi:hypothetical protein
MAPPAERATLWRVPNTAGIGLEEAALSWTVVAPFAYPMSGLSGNAPVGCHCQSALVQDIAMESKTSDGTELDLQT